MLKSLNDSLEKVRDIIGLEMRRKEHSRDKFRDTSFNQGKDSNNGIRHTGACPTKTRTCYVCGKMGHLVSACSSNPNPIEQKKVPARVFTLTKSNAESNPSVVTAVCYAVAASGRADVGTKNEPVVLPLPKFNPDRLIPPKLFALRVYLVIFKKVSSTASSRPSLLYIVSSLSLAAEPPPFQGVIALNGGFLVDFVNQYYRKLKMSLIGQLRRCLPYGYFRKPIEAPVTVPCLINLLGVSRNFAQPALKQEEEVEEVEIDQRRLPADYNPETFDPTEHRSPPTERVWRLVDEISGLTLVEAAELSSIMMKKLGMKELPVVGVMNPGAARVASVAMKASTTAKEEKKPEKTAFELKMESFDSASKLKVIKEIRSFTDFGLKEAKDLVEKVPVVLKKGVPKEEAEKIIEKMKAVGAVVVME
ncbi:unnamed protein product [Fraxinus pennsylvanica]|uniref:Large ribosomal subunit protein bL12c n=1 Tax=Fraxinus pennsylvanica TaxID=56036 RepID=A0AAD2A9B1_9LAMI|nr:unnamed protein product [Fraxinus pennsylvanica]